jgi:hypothetical protein
VRKGFSIVLTLSTYAVIGLTAAYAGTVNIDDTPGTPTFTVSSDITDVAVVTNTPGSLVFNGTFHIPLGGGVMCPIAGDCDQSFNVINPDSTVSDTVDLVFHGAGGPGPSDWLETFTLTFQDDPGAPLSGGTDVAETPGLSQAMPIDNSGVTGTSFQINVTSSEAPEPGSLFLLGAGLLGLVVGRKRLAKGFSA